jgi:hypothetical protein
VDAEAIIGAVEGVTKKWAKQRKAEERRASARSRRAYVFRPARLTIKEVAGEVMRDAYLKASGGGKLPAHARQVMYCARGPIQEKTGKPLDDQYFCQTLLPDYLRNTRAKPKGGTWCSTPAATSRSRTPARSCRWGRSTSAATSAASAGSRR